MRGRLSKLADKVNARGYSVIQRYAYPDDIGISLRILKTTGPADTLDVDFVCDEAHELGFISHDWEVEGREIFVEFTNGAE